MSDSCIGISLLQDKSSFQDTSDQQTLSEQERKDIALQWKRRNELMSKLQESYYDVEQEVRGAVWEVTRASSIVENLNSRLRRYFFVRRQIGNGYLDLLRFYLNHRRYPRSRRKERVGKSPIQLLSGEDHPHWLELLGFDRFSQN